MSSPTSFDLETLLKQAARTRVDCRLVCGPKAAILYSATNLYGVLRRLQQETTAARSSLSTSTSASSEELVAFYTESACLLTETSEFLLAYKTLGYYENKILGSWEFASFSEAQRSIIHYFDTEMTRLSYDASRILIMASAESLGELREQLEYSAGTPLSPILEDLTARLIANGDLRFSMLIKGAGNEQILWEALHQELVGMSVDSAMLDRHRNVILRYVRALERRSAFSGSLESTPITAAKSTETVRPNSAKRRSLGGENDAGGKRARTSAISSEDRQHSEAEEAPGAGKRGTSFRFRDPRTTFGPEVDDDLLSDFLEEEADQSQEASLRTQIRDTYRTLCDDYEPKYEMNIFFRTGSDGHDEKQIAGLIHDIEKKVVMELDNLELGHDACLRNLRKMIIIKAQKMLDDLEKIVSK
ncbi:MAG: hypothetical protein Q9168_003917 [Polycauliona sp. 1 TL-2023]